MPIFNQLPISTESHKISQITDQLYLSGLGGVTKEDNLKKLNIKVVLNLAVELSSLKYNNQDITVRYVSLQDNSKENILPYLSELVDYIHFVITRGDNIVVHCVGGVSRSATVVIAYLIKIHSMSLREAYNFVQTRRTIIRPNISFWRSLISFEEDIRGESTVELLPYITGLVPDIYKEETERRIKNGWMDYIFYNWLLHLCILIIQILASSFTVTSNYY
ncbi:hypothetical protein LOTGIDRAFT_167725 [Lottia gigantea]|uniref:Protein-tyrosine-phosphatase n=1 Tax=Lottia gigantea TaxID=225164 RepID=V3ZT60_LOTGI|nr:hypothetical protein LOTGIDRAFT_167725 [Lottia gigantea]ESO85755.1 hypothetical protein LOTGIDRAFT_167725 [Lottia gigantea]